MKKKAVEKVSRVIGCSVCETQPEVLFKNYLVSGYTCRLCLVKTSYDEGLKQGKVKKKLWEWKKNQKEE
jgi:hypothetical protein